MAEEPCIIASCHLFAPRVVAKRWPTMHRTAQPFYNPSRVEGCSAARVWPGGRGRGPDVWTCMHRGVCRVVAQISAPARACARVHHRPTRELGNPELEFLRAMLEAWRRWRAWTQCRHSECLTTSNLLGMALVVLLLMLHECLLWRSLTGVLRSAFLLHFQKM